MSTTQNLELSAINAAKKGDWAQAIVFNQNIITANPDDTAALNRLGFAYLQNQQLDLAEQTFQTVLTLDKHNPIAQKQLTNIKNKTISTPQFQAQNFVEEPSKSKIIALSRLASKQVLLSLHVGQELILKPKSRFISIETPDKIYLGSMPEDISLRLSQLIATGNRYFCQLHSSTSNHCSIFVKEIYQSPANVHRLSFDSSYQAEDDENIGDDLLLLADEVPINIVHDDSDSDAGANDNKNDRDED